MSSPAAAAPARLSPDFSPAQPCLRLSPLAVASMVHRKVLRRAEPALEAMADKTWEIAPGTSHPRRPAYYLPEQMNRVTGWAYMDDPRRELATPADLPQKPTLATLVRDAVLADGTIYKWRARTYLSPRRHRLPQILVDQEIARAALCGTCEGLGFFGLWLTDDCALYPLAEAEGIPLTSDQAPSPHMVAYEDWLGLRPLRPRAAHLRELVLFQDEGHNLDKGRRWQAMRERLLARFPGTRHPGVFILRRGSGKRRLMHDEEQVARHLAEKRGFRIVDVTADDLGTILQACAGAEVVAGVEGSHLIHGVLMLGHGGSVLALQPPDRFCLVLKRTLDRDEQNFGFVVGQPAPGGFRVDLDEVERTLDLLPRQS